MLNFASAVLDPPIGRLSIYNWLRKGRERLPYGVNLSDKSVETDNLDAALASHRISASPKPPTEYRVLVLGDSAVWGVSVGLADSLTGQLNEARLSACGKQIKFYNLAFPIPSVLKDFVILNKGLKCDPDLVVWLVTLNGLAVRAPPTMWGAELYGQISGLLHQYELDRYQPLIGSPPGLLDRTLLGGSKEIAQVVTLQLDGLPWDLTGTDTLPLSAGPLSPNAAASETYIAPSVIPGRADARFNPPELDRQRMEYDVLAAAQQMMRGHNVMVVDEPIFIASGRNSDIRYNNMYLRWAFDQFREQLQAQMHAQGWLYLDLYNAVPPDDFTGTVFRMTPAGEQQLAQLLAPHVVAMPCH